MAHPQAIPNLTDLVRERRPDFIFWIETLCDEIKILETKAILGYDYSFVVDRRGHSGGLALLWNNNVDVSVLGSSDRHIDVTVTLQGESPYHMIGFYGYSNRQLRALSWTLMRDLAQLSNLP